MKGTIRIGGALILAIAVIAGALYVRNNQSETKAAETNGVAVEATPSAHIENIDSDGDGVMDWEEELTRNIFERIETPVEEVATAVSEEEQAQTLTGEFGRVFFESFMRGKTGAGIYQSEGDLISSAVSAIESETSSKQYTRANVSIVEDSDFAIREYGNLISNIAMRHTVEGMHEFQIFSEALQTRDAEKLKDLQILHDAYEDAIIETLEAPTPQSLVRTHLDLINTYEAIRTDIQAMQVAFTDPLYTLARIKRYQDDVYAVYYAFQNIYRILSDRGVVYANDESGSFLYAFENEIEI